MKNFGCADLLKAKEKRGQTSRPDTIYYIFSRLKANSKYNFVDKTLKRNSCKPIALFESNTFDSVELSYIFMILIIYSKCHSIATLTHSLVKFS